MNKDISVRCGEGVVNIRVGAIIIKDKKVRIAEITVTIITILWAGASSLAKLPNKHNTRNKRRIGQSWKAGQARFYL